MNKLCIHTMEYYTANRMHKCNYTQQHEKMLQRSWMKEAKYKNHIVSFHLCKIQKLGKLISGDKSQNCGHLVGGSDQNGGVGGFKQFWISQQECWLYKCVQFGKTYWAVHLGYVCLSVCTVLQFLKKVYWKKICGLKYADISLW